MVIGPAGVICAIGIGLTVTVSGAEVPLHPSALVIVTVKVSDAFTLIVADSSPLLQSIESPVTTGDTVRFTEFPSQKVVGPSAVMTGVGFAVTVLPVVALNAVGGVHSYVFAPDADIIVTSPRQIEVDGVVRITGKGFTVTF